MLLALEQRLEHVVVLPHLGLDSHLLILNAAALDAALVTLLLAAREGPLEQAQRAAAVGLEALSSAAAAAATTAAAALPIRRLLRPVRLVRRRRM